MIFEQEPADFSPVFTVVSLFCEVQNEILLLKRLPYKSEGNKWGLPAGKVDPNETLLEAMKREFMEETGIVTEERMRYLRELCVRYPEYDFRFHMFHLPLPYLPEVKLGQSEHSEYTWVNPQSALKMALVKDNDACIKMFYPDASRLV